MKINGKYLGWAIIHLVFFVYMIFNDFNYDSLERNIYVIILTVFLGWRFIDNMKEAFE